MTWYYGKSLSDATQYGFYTVGTECTDPVEVSDADYASLMGGCTCNKHIEPNAVGYPVLVNGGYVENVPSEVFYKNVENPLAEATDECTIQKGQYEPLKNLEVINDPNPAFSLITVTLSGLGNIPANYTTPTNSGCQYHNASLNTRRALRYDSSMSVFQDKTVRYNTLSKVEESRRIYGAPLSTAQQSALMTQIENQLVGGYVNQLSYSYPSGLIILVSDYGVIYINATVTNDVITEVSLFKLCTFQMMTTPSLPMDGTYHVGFDKSNNPDAFVSDAPVPSDPIGDNIIIDNLPVE